MSALNRLRHRPRLWASAGLVATGLASGAVLGATMTASAATTTTAPAASSSSSGGTAGPQCHGGGYHVPGQSGTVTAVGSDSVTISGKTYKVTSTSDIDKNGEATLSDLKVGDAVTFDTVQGASTPTIAHLHAGNEALDRPSGPPPGAPRPAGGSNTVG